MRRFLVPLVVAGLAMSGALAPIGPGSGRAAAAKAPGDLLDALERAELVALWYDRSPVSPRLAAVAVSGNGSEDARAVVVALATELADGRAEARFLTATLTNRIDRLEALTRREDRLEAQIAANQRELDGVRLALQQQAVARYMLGDGPDLPLATSVSISTGEQARAVAFDALATDLITRKRDLESRLGDLGDRLSDTRTDRATTQGEADRITADLAEVRSRNAELEAVLPGAIDTAHHRRLLATVDGLGLPLVVLDAYVTAADAQAAETPWCAIRWPLLAGIAMVESHHGTFHANAVQANGRTTGTIFGPLLDGSLPATMVIRDTDGGAYDANSSFDRAIGPFQFLPSTWRIFARDGNGDGLTDPHNIYDGARSAAAYLCHHNGLGTADQLDRAIRAYNDSGAYVRQVLGYAAVYEAFAVPMPS